jgi:alkylated DNA repair dioxygenase AlkB
LINYYDATARMGMHPDKDEETDEPVVSLSIGDCCLHQSGTSACPRLAGPGRYGALRFSV